MWRSRLCIPIMLLATTLSAATAQADSKNKTFTSEFMTERCTFTPTGVNPYFVLIPDFQLTLAGTVNKEAINLTITVLDDTVDVDFMGRTITTRVVEEFETADGAATEISRNLFAICQETNSVFYFGEEVDIYEGGVIVGHEGAWLAGQNGALPGIIMPGTVLLGGRYFQEIAPDVALDQAEILSMEPCEVLGATVENCVTTQETTPLEPGAKDIKVYAPGVGLVQDADLSLTSLTSP